MNTSRRDFLGSVAAVPFAAALSGLAPRTRPGRLLVLGGTRFLGPPIVRTAEALGYEVTLFNRGKSNPARFPKLEQLEGDRDTGNLESLRGKKWDAVIDTSGYAPKHVEQSCNLLKDSVGRYLFVSTVSVYTDQSAASVDESTPTGIITPEEFEAATTIKAAVANYGPMKAECDRIVERVFGARATVVRPGLIVGPDDSSDRFTYWPLRILRGGTALVPEDLQAEVQFVDVRDLGDFCVKLVQDQAGGIFNAVGFRGRVSFADLLSTCKLTLNTEATWESVSEAFLREHKVRPYTELPLWLPKGQRGHFAVEKAIAAGLSFRSIAETIVDTVAWHKTRPADTKLRAGLTPEREAELQKAWRSRSK